MRQRAAAVQSATLDNGFPRCAPVVVRLLGLFVHLRDHLLEPRVEIRRIGARPDFVPRVETRGDRPVVIEEEQRRHARAIGVGRVFRPSPSTVERVVLHKRLVALDDSLRLVRRDAMPRQILGTALVALALVLRKGISPGDVVVGHRKHVVHQQRAVRRRPRPRVVRDVDDAQRDVVFLRPCPELVYPADLVIIEMVVGHHAIRAPERTTHQHHGIGLVPAPAGVKRLHLVRHHIDIHRPLSEGEGIFGLLANPQRILWRVGNLFAVDEGDFIFGHHVGSRVKKSEFHLLASRHAVRMARDGHGYVRL